MNPSEVEPSLENGFLCGSCDLLKTMCSSCGMEASFAEIVLISGNATEKQN